MVDYAPDEKVKSFESGAPTQDYYGIIKFKETEDNDQRKE